MSRLTISRKFGKFAMQIENLDMTLPRTAILSQSLEHLGLVATPEELTAAIAVSDQYEALLAGGTRYVYFGLFMAGDTNDADIFAKLKSLCPSDAF